jgi:hypothetical protein
VSIRISPSWGILVDNLVYLQYFLRDTDKSPFNLVNNSLCVRLFSLLCVLQVILLHNRDFIGGGPGLFILVLQQDGANCASRELGTDGPIVCISVD